MGTVHLGKLSLAIVMAMFAAAAVYISSLIADRQQALNQVSRYNVAWSASQAATELARLEYQLGALDTPDIASPDDVALRYEVLANRLTLLDSGEMRAFSQRDPELRQVIVDLGAALAAIQPLVPNIEQPGNALKALGWLSPLDAKLVRFAAAANRYGGEQVSSDQQLLIRLHHTFSLLMAGLIAAGLILCGLLISQNRLLRRAHCGLRELTDHLRLANEEAEHAKEEAERAKEKAEMADVAKSDFLAKMSHELRTPLNAVIGYSEMLLDDAEADGNEQQRQDLTRIVAAGRHLLALVNEVLDLSKIEAGRMELDRSLVELERLVDDAAATAQPLVERNGNELVVERATGLGNIEGDETKLRQIILNLLSNAAKFTKNGRVVLAAWRDTEGWITMSVRDDGIGISPAGMAKLFGNFIQVHAPAAGQYGGTGLGLAVSRKLARLMGGDITVESRVGEGSNFTLRIPPVAPEAAAEADPDDAAFADAVPVSVAA
jgi:signal transduction histidine kinase